MLSFVRAFLSVDGLADDVVMLYRRIEENAEADDSRGLGQDIRRERF